MRVILARVFLVLALCGPVAVWIALFVAVEIADNIGGWGWLVMAILATLFLFFGFGTLAVMLAVPENENGKTARRVGLGVLGVVCSFIGSGFLALIFLADPSVVVILVPMALLLPLGLAAIVVLIRDMMVSRPPGGWPKVLALIGFAFLALCVMLFDRLQSLEGIVLVSVFGPLLLLVLAAAFQFGGSRAARTEDTPKT
jgi:hypothetical protein